MDIFSIKGIKVVDELEEIAIKADGGRCPLATRDIAENLKNRQNCIDTAGYGPLNPKMANDSFWQAKADRWKVTISDSKKQLCGNCAAFIKTPRIMECIEDGLGNEEGDSAWDVIEAGDLGYCEAFDFKCAASRTCDAWIVGGPITEEKEEKKYPFLDIDQKELDAMAYVDSIDDDEFNIMFPDDSEETINDATWLFGSSKGFIRRLLFGGRGRRRKAEEDGALLEGKAAKKPVLRDPKGGLTAAGRKHFAKTEGSNLKPGVKGPADTPEKMRRKGSFLVRFFSNPRGPMKDENGKPTRLALSAAAWGEPVPQTRAAALKLAAKGRRLLDRYRSVKEAQKKKIADLGDLQEKQLGTPVSSRTGTVANSRQNNPARQNKPTSIGSGSSSSDVRYDPDAIDRDGDGSIQEGTDYARPVQNNQDADKKPRTTNVGSADTLERNAIRDRISKLNIDWNSFGQLMRNEIAKLKPGDKTNWNPGRLPNGGKISTDGTYIPPSAVREDDMRISNYYARRRSGQNTNAQTPPRASESTSSTSPTGSADALDRRLRPTVGETTSTADEGPAVNRTLPTGTPDSLERRMNQGQNPPVSQNAPVSPSQTSGSPDAIDRRSRPTVSENTSTINEPTTVNRTSPTGTPDSLERRMNQGQNASVSENAPPSPSQTSGSPDAIDRAVASDDNQNQVDDSVDNDTTPTSPTGSPDAIERRRRVQQTTGTTQDASPEQLNDSSARQTGQGASQETRTQSTEDTESRRQYYESRINAQREQERQDNKFVRDEIDFANEPVASSAPSTGGFSTLNSNFSAEAFTSMLSGSSPTRFPPQYSAWQDERFSSLTDGQVILVKNLPDAKNMTGVMEYGFAQNINGTLFMVETDKKTYDAMKENEATNKNKQTALSQTSEYRQKIDEIQKSIQDMSNAFPNLDSPLKQVSIYASPSPQDAQYTNGVSITGGAVTGSSSYVIFPSSFSTGNSGRTVVHETAHLMAGATPSDETFAVGNGASISWDDAQEMDRTTSSDYADTYGFTPYSDGSPNGNLDWDTGDSLHTPLVNGGPGVSKYGETSAEEDWADSFMLYTLSKLDNGLGVNDDGEIVTFEDLYPMRAKIIREWIQEYWSK